MDEPIHKVSVNIVVWNSLRYLPGCFKSIYEQTFQDFSVMAIDNSSRDKSVQFLESKYPQAKLIRNSRNLGFSRAHNQGIRFGRGEYILVTNPDIVMEPSCLAEMVKVMEKDEKIGSVGAKLLRMESEATDLDRAYGRKTDVIDSTGFRMYRSHKAVDRGQGKKDSGQYDKEEEVFGISGALVLLRRKALEDAAFGEDYFDADFFAYKEDLDLAWRLRLLGWKSVYAPSAVAYHYRAVGIGAEARLKEIREKRRGRPKLIKHYSYKNHLCMLAKNVLGANFARDFHYIVGYEFKKLAYILLFEPSTIRGFFGFIKDLPKTTRKRKALMRKRRVSPEEIRKWFMGKKK